MSVRSVKLKITKIYKNNNLLKIIQFVQNCPVQTDAVENSYCAKVSSCKNDPLCKKVLT